MKARCVATSTSRANDHARAEVIARITGTAEKGQFLVEPVPAGGDDVAPDIPWIPSQGIPKVRQRAVLILKHRTRSDLQSCLP